MDRYLSADQALARLREGNARFVQHVVSLDALLSHAQRSEQARAQHPFAVILGCSDSRVPAEFVFDQGLGDLFVIRVAGNIAAPSQIGSIEFAVDRFGVKLVVVLGHSNCGAIRATLDYIANPSEASPGIHAIVDRIRPTLTSLVSGCECHDEAELMQNAVRANVRATVAQLRQSSVLLEGLHLAGELKIVGADYSLETGAVAFFEGD
ncbi:carbonic anhydrase [Pseudomarimonas arenosa]|uniref:carbonic anhydrase n=1 Tax=Pseudomarimonas arenosa TaxID=2774145 RepID=A0AAW3ZJY8_9GAMM|nr:carbonic anhydrase [Pseudomarimonas arenosa]MBD8526288.1 carbonic anhydrase [Pseudomarimonas arenosa]